MRAQSAYNNNKIYYNISNNMYTACKTESTKRTRCFRGEDDKSMQLHPIKDCNMKGIYICIIGTSIMIASYCLVYAQCIVPMYSVY